MVTKDLLQPLKYGNRCGKRNRIQAFFLHTTWIVKNNLRRHTEMWKTYTISNDHLSVVIAFALSNTDCSRKIIDRVNQKCRHLPCYSKTFNYNTKFRCNFICFSSSFLCRCFCDLFRNQRKLTVSNSNVPKTSTVNKSLRLSLRLSLICTKLFVRLQLVTGSLTVFEAVTKHPPFKILYTK